ncbi:5-oxoprolinase subunit PxpA [Undibacterium flavidum]|uniref:5-oxoprolinase subunit PxpA n=1 Tax=Undibacterium flavidum TaxID=2762297 RepID=A0ABR6Y8D2_9BURK|nr:5-oxoprolinase subunit PxpA [Undibacterium flavidum]MBC3872424.1 5-oxoprolinase subunit PxpA [Undibacterium flavidum]
MHKSSTTLQTLPRIDLNADLGEGGQHDAAILKIVSSANIACGGHVGDTDSMRTAVRLARANDVAIGAHPSFVDKENFGRSVQHPSPEILFEQLCEQVNSLIQIAEQEGCVVQHLKPHGALYNQAAKDSELGAILIRVIQDCQPQLRLVALAGSALVTQAAAAGIHVIQEAFADRRYNNDGSLRARTFPDACIEDDAEAVQQTLKLVQHQQLQSVSGELISVRAETLCVHGDGVHALHLLESIRAQLVQLGVTIAAPEHS